MHFRLDDEKKLWQPLNEQNVCSDLVHCTRCLLIVLFTLCFCSPFEVVELKTLRHDRLQSPSHQLIGQTHLCERTFPFSTCKVEEADHIYLLMKEEYRISRNVRLAWFLGKLNQVIWPASKPELVS